MGQPLSFIYSAHKELKKSRMEPGTQSSQETSVEWFKYLIHNDLLLLCHFRIHNVRPFFWHTLHALPHFISCTHDLTSQVDFKFGEVTSVSLSGHWSRPPSLEQPCNFSLWKLSLPQFVIHTVLVELTLLPTPKRMCDSHLLNTT